MVDQAAVNGGGPRVRINSPLADGVIGNLAEFGNDVATLAELQAKLAAIDLKESAGRAALPTAGLVVGLGLALGALPVLLLGFGELIVAYAHWGRAGAYLLVAGLTLGLAGLLAVLCALRLPSSFSSFRRSSEEFSRNLSWLKTVLSHSGRPAPHHRR